MSKTEKGKTQGKLSPGKETPVEKSDINPSRVLSEQPPPSLGKRRFDLTTDALRKGLPWVSRWRLGSYSEMVAIHRRDESDVGLTVRTRMNQGMVLVRSKCEYFDEVGEGEEARW